MEGAVVSRRRHPRRFLLQRRYKLMLQRSPEKSMTGHVVPPAYTEQLSSMPEAEISKRLAMDTLGYMANVAELLKRFNKLSASEVKAKRLHKELNACKKMLTTQEEKIATFNLHFDQVCGQLTEAKSEIVELKAHIYDLSKTRVDKTTKVKAVNAKLRKRVKVGEEREKDMAKRLENLCLENEVMEKKYASLVDDTNWLLGNASQVQGFCC